MHDSVMQFVTEQVAAKNLARVRSVLEVGSQDINGSVRSLFQPRETYIGVDVVAGRGVDRVLNDPGRLPYGDSSFSLVVSTEMLEHCARPTAIVAECFRVLKPAGFFLITTRSEGFPPHHPPDYWRFSVSQLYDLLKWSGFVEVFMFPDPQHPGVFGIGRSP